MYIVLRYLSKRLSQDGERVAAVCDSDLYVFDFGVNRWTRIAKHTNDNISFGQAEFVACEEMDRTQGRSTINSHCRSFNFTCIYLLAHDDVGFATGLWLSPSGSQILYQRTDVSQVETWYIMHPEHPEREPSKAPYPRPGNIPTHFYAQCAVALTSCARVVGKNNAQVSLFISPTNAIDDPTPIGVEWDSKSYPYLVTLHLYQSLSLSI
jgi:hypothetical protein